MKKFIWILALAGLLSACSSGIKLSDVPVEDKAGSSVSTSNNSGNPQSKEATKSSQSANQSNSSANQSNPNTISNSSISSSAQDPKNSATSSANSNPTSTSTSTSSASNASTADMSLSGPSNTVKKIYFDYDSYIVKPQFQSVIESHAQYLKANTRSKVSLEGHTDERGSREYNLALGQKRADAVRQSLTLLGVNPAQIESVSFGEEKPELMGNDEAAYEKNRRVEFFYK